MAVLIDVNDVQLMTSPATLQQGDMLSLKASGGHINSGTEIVRFFGPFVSGFMRSNGEVLSPEGAPGTLLIFAQRPGRAIIEVFTGDPWFSPVKTALEIIVI